MNWNDVLDFTRNNPAPDRKLVKSDEEWKQQLTPMQYRVTRRHGTERLFSGEHCSSFSPGIYSCVCCGTALFDSTVKFNSGTGWPSFTEPVKENAIHYKMDKSLFMKRVEMLCNVCDAHLGHVFPDGPRPSGLRFCINSVSLKKEGAKEKEFGHKEATLKTATLGGGCFWCVEAIFDELAGVRQVVSGYAGGKAEAPTYRQVCNGGTGHAEVVQIDFDPQTISYADLLRVFLAMHNPTSLNRQGADKGTQYRSIILYHNKEQQATAQQVIAELQPHFDKPVVMEVIPFVKFYRAEENHQRYYSRDPARLYCQAVIDPKLQKLRKSFENLVKRKTADVP